MGTYVQEIYAFTFVIKLEEQDEVILEMYVPNILEIAFKLVKIVFCRQRLFPAYPPEKVFNSSIN